MRSIGKNKALTLLFLFIVSALITTGCSQKKDEIKEDAVPVTVMETAMGSIKDVKTFTGKIEAGDEVKITGKISGRVKNAEFDIGDYVEQGEPLIILDTDELYDQLSQAQAALAAAKANLAANQSGSLPQQLEQAKAAYEQAEANYLNAEADYNRMKALYEEEAISQQSFEAAQLKYTVSKSQYESAKEQYRLTQESQPKNLEAIKAQVDQAQAQVDTVKTNIENSVVRAPVSGMISSKQIQPGEICQAGATLGSVVNIDNVSAVIEVPEDDVNKIGVGKEAQVSISALSGSEPLNCTISTVSPASETSRLFQVKMDLENRDHKLKPGMFADVEIDMGQKDSVITIPKDAVLIKKNGNVVYVAKDGKAEERPVKLGVTNGDLVEVADGLKPGEKVVTSGQDMLTEGAALKIMQ